MDAHARRLPAVAADAAVAAPRAAAAVPAVGGEPAPRVDAAARHRPAARRGARRMSSASSPSSAATRPARCRSASRGRPTPPTGGPIPGDKALERILAELPSKPFLVGEDGVSMSLAGVQTKLGVAIDDKGRICVPINGAPSTWILKPDSERLFGGVQNEALCLVLAKRLGLNAPEVTTGKAGKRTYLMVKRYDRVEQSGRWRRLHQEDFCQALGKPPSAKYEFEPDRHPRTDAGGDVRRDAQRHAGAGRGQPARLRDLQRARLQHRRARQELFDDDLRQRLQAGADLRRDVRAGVGARDAQHGAEDRRQEPRRASEAPPLAALRRRRRAQRARASSRASRRWPRRRWSRRATPRPTSRRCRPARIRSCSR